LIDQFFRLRENRTDARTEVLAGATTFVTLAYILFVNPNILKDAGMPLEATCVASAFSTLVMGLYANYPIAVAPGMA
jgi:AGZA family xanthine/uracil permease-like MFS transporter